MLEDTQRSFILGDSWLYYKIYTGPKTSDAILTNIIKPISEELINKGIIDKWFFVRYSDPKHHLRIRFHCMNSECIGVIISILFLNLKKYLEDDLIWKVQTDTYQRELERYGSNSMVLSEELFYYDSKMVVDFIDMIEGHEGDELRWLFSLRAIDSLLDSFKYSLEDKKDLLVEMSLNFRNEFDPSRVLGKQLNIKYRVERKKIDAFMEFKNGDNFEYKTIIALIEQKEQYINPIVNGILELKKNNNLQVDLNILISSYIHMLMNRLFRSKNRLNEMVCYDYLYRYYKSIYARK